MALNPTYQKQLEDYKKSEKERERIEREAIQKLINEKLATATSDINKQIAAVPGQYIDQERAVEARRIANERNLMEQMARAGAYGSGFSDTMQASINIAAGNQQAALDRQKQEAINRLNQTLLELQSALRQEEISRLADLSSRTSANIANKQSELFALQKQEEAAAAQAKAAQLQAAAQAKAAQLQAQATAQKQLEDRFASYVDAYLKNNPNATSLDAYKYAEIITGYTPTHIRQLAQQLQSQWNNAYNRYRSIGYNDAAARAYADRDVFGLDITGIANQNVAASTNVNPAAKSQGELIRNFRALGG